MGSKKLKNLEGDDQMDEAPIEISDDDGPDQDVALAEGQALLED